MEPGTNFQSIAMTQKTRTACFIFVALLTFLSLFVLTDGYSRIQESDKINDLQRISLLGKKKALATLQVIIDRKNGAPATADLLLQLAENQQEAAAIASRLSYSETKQSPSVGPKSEAKAILRNANYSRESENLYFDSIRTADKLIRNYPKYPLTSRGYYLKAKARKELGQRLLAITEYSYFVNQYPKSKEVSLAIITLADLMMENKQYTSAIPYLVRLLTHRKDLYYPLACNRLSWVYFHIHQIPTAIRYASFEVEYYDFKSQTSPQAASEKDKGLNNIALFYTAALDQKLNGFALIKAFAYFKLISGKKFFDKALIHFSYALRAKGLRSELVELKRLSIDEEIPHASKLQIVTIAFEHHLNQNLYTELLDEIGEMNRILSDAQDPETLAQNARKSLTEASIQLLESYRSKKLPIERKAVALTLEKVYLSLLQPQILNKEEAPKIHFNLAELQFDQKKYQAATQNYYWVVSHSKQFRDVSLFNAILSRYEEMKANKLFPKDISPKSMKTESQNPPDKGVLTWIEWIDTYLSTGKRPKEVELFAFEGNRFLYERGHLKNSIQRSLDFLKQQPGSKFEISTLSMVIDTYVASNLWDETIDLTTHYLEIKNWGTPEARKKLQNTFEFATYQNIVVAYQAKKYKTVIASSDDFLKLSPELDFQNKTLVLAANSALALEDRTQALRYFAPLLKQKSTLPSTLTQAYLTEASVFEDQYQFGNAVHAYKNLFSIPVNTSSLRPEDQTLKEKALLIAWLSGQLDHLRFFTDLPGFCNGAVKGKCEEYRLWLEIQQSSKIQVRAKDVQERFQVALREKNHVGLLSLSYATKHSDLLSFEKRLQLYQMLKSQLEPNPSLFYFALAPDFMSDIHRSLQITRKEIRAIASFNPYQFDPRIVKRRTQLIVQFENIIEEILEIHWTNIRADALQELANTYNDFIEATLPQPQKRRSKRLVQTIPNVMLEELRRPFERKRDSIREKAFILASDSSVNAELFSGVAEKYFFENSHVLEKLNKEREGYQPTMKFDVSRWLYVLSVDSKNSLTSSFIEAVKLRNFQKVAYLLQEASNKGLWQEKQLSLARGISLAMVGAKSEALQEIEESLPSWDSKRKVHVMVPVIVSFFETYSYEKTKLLLTEFLDLKGYKPSVIRLSETEAAVLEVASNWTSQPESEKFSENYRSINSAINHYKARGRDFQGTPSSETLTEVDP